MRRSHCHPEGDDRALDHELDGRGRAHAEHDLLELGQEERAQPVATTLPTPPASDVPPSTTAAIVGRR